jgi:FkbM family methyltransferase
MPVLRTLLRMVLPFGLVDLRRKRIHFRRLGMQVPLWRTLEHERLVQESRFELWPRELKASPGRWTLIDVGANEGHFSRAAAILGRPARVLAVEPQADCQAALRARLEDMPGCTIFKLAMGSARGTVTLNRTRSGSFASTLRPIPGISAEYGNSAELIGTEDVELSTVDAIAEAAGLDEVGLLKIDVQGAELEVLKGARNTLQRTTAVLLEINYVAHYHRASPFRDVNHYLEAEGFSLFGVSSPCLGRSGALWADAIYVRNAAVRLDWDAAGAAGGRRR